MIGQRLAHFDITAKLGESRMGARRVKKLMRLPIVVSWATFDSSDPTTKNSPAVTAVRERVRVY